VRALPAHSTLEVAGGEARIVTRPIPMATSDSLGFRSRRALVGDLVDSLIASAAPLRRFPERIMLSLTGGRDSRLLAAALHVAGIRFRAATSGVPDHPDMILAARIARLFGVEHRAAPPARDSTGDALVIAHPARRAWDVIRSTEGMISAHNSVAGPRTFRITPAIAGAGGEQLRGGFLASQTSDDPEQLRERVRDMFRGSLDLMTDAANEHASADLEPWLDLDPLHALDRIYLYHRSGRWSAAARAATTVGQPSYNLLFDNLLNRRALAIPPGWRWSERPVYEAIRRLAPALRDLPLVKKRWRFDRRPPPWPFRRAWRGREPLRVDHEGAGFDWRNQPNPELLQIFREQILGGPASLFDLVRRDRMEALLGSERLKKPDAIFVWNAYTASVLLSGRWLEARPEAEPLRIARPSAG
jgi:hypothetical protein